MVIIEMQSTGQTSRHDSQPVQLSALMIATSLGSFLRGPALAIIESPLRTVLYAIASGLRRTSRSARDFFHKSIELYVERHQSPTKQLALGERRGRASCTLSGVV